MNDPTHRYCQAANRAQVALMDYLVPAFMSAAGEAVILTRSALTDHGYEQPEPIVFVGGPAGVSVAIYNKGTVPELKHNEFAVVFQIPADELIAFEDALHKLRTEVTPAA